MDSGQLAHHGDAAGNIPSLHAPDICPVDEYVPARQRQQSGCGPQQCCFPAAIGPQKAQVLMAVRAKGDMPNHIGAAIPATDILKLQKGGGFRFCCHHAVPFLPLPKYTQAKNGAPISAVTAPTGSSIGVRMVREIKSANTMNVPPKRAESGTTYRWDAPNTLRVTCGAIRSMNPI